MDSKQLLNSFFQSTNLNSLTEAVSQEMCCSVIVVDDAFRIVSCFAHDSYDDPVYKRAVSHSELSIETSRTISENVEKIEDNAFWTERDGKKYRISFLCCGNIKLGYLICIFESDEVVSVNDSEFGLAENLLSKQLFYERHHGDVLIGTAEEIMKNLLDGEFSDEAHFRLQADSTYLSNFFPERFALIDISGYNKQDLSDKHLLIYLNDMFHGSHPFIYKGRIILFLHKDHDLKLLKDNARKYSLKIVLSEKIKDIYSIRDIYTSVEKILEYLMSKNKSEYFMEKSENYLILILLMDLKERDDLIDERVKALLKYDTENNSELCITLYTYMICHHSLKETCEKLYTHRNTVLYRIRRIKDDFGICIDLPEMYFRYLISAALAIIRLNREDIFIGSGN